METLFQNPRPSTKVLLTMASTIVVFLGPDGPTISRQDKRRLDLLVGQFNFNYDQVRRVIPMLVIKYPNQTFVGPNADITPQILVSRPDSIPSRLARGESIADLE
jgi:hypothetical protein